MTTPLQIRKAHTGDFVSVLGNLREEDALELAAYGVTDPLGQCLPALLRTNVDAYAITSGADTLALYGVTQEAHDAAHEGRIWMMHREGASAPTRAYLELAKQAVEELNDRYPLLFNQKWAGNRHHLRWLTKLGFQVLRLVRRGDVHEYEFVRIR